MKLIPTRKTYNSCEELPLANFIKIVVDNDLSQLFKEPAKFIHKQPDLKAIWEAIFEEYNELTNSAQSRQIFSLIKDITVLQNRIQIVNDCISVIMGASDLSGYEPTINILKSYGCNFEFTNENKREQCEKAITVCKRYLRELMEREQEYSELNKDDGKKVTTQDFYNSIAMLSKAMGFPIDLHNTTVSLYISYINQVKSANSIENGK